MACVAKNDSLVPANVPFGGLTLVTITFSTMLDLARLTLTLRLRLTPKRELQSDTAKLKKIVRVDVDRNPHLRRPRELRQPHSDNVLHVQCATCMD